MKKMIQMLRMTIVGGALFMVPFVILIIILSKAYEILRKIILPVADSLPFESFIGLKTPWILTTALLVLICLVLGLFAKTKPASTMVKWLESALLSNLPGYSFMKNLGDEYSEVAPTQYYQSVLVRFDEAWQIAFLVERIEGGHVVVFVPASPSPWTGSVIIVEEERVTVIDERTTSAVKCLQKIGAGVGSLVSGKL